MRITLELTPSEWAVLTGAAGWAQRRSYSLDGMTLEESTDSSTGTVAEFTCPEDAELAEALFGAFARACENAELESRG
jgi:hypothetical protein